MSKILITGASRGIGQALALQLLRNGNQVIGLARQQTIEHEAYTHYQVDLALNNLEPDFKNMVKSHPDISTLIGCAGYGDFKEVEQFSYEQMQRLMQVNFLSQALLTKLVLPLIKKQQGKIIFIGSEAALTGQKKGSFYCASKFALRGFAQSLRAECTTANVAVSLINPGLVDTTFFDELNFRPGKDQANSIAIEQVVAMVDMILQQANNCVVEEINCQPLKKVVAR